MEGVFSFYRQNRKIPDIKITLHHGRFKVFDYNTELEIYKWIEFI